MSDNPFLSPSPHPHDVPDFPAVRAEHVLPAVEWAIAQARARVGSLRDDPAPPDFENTISALESASEELERILGVFYNLLSAEGTEDMQVLAEQIGPLAAHFSNDVQQDPVLAERVRRVHDRAQSGTLSLTIEQKTLLEETWKGFVRGGAFLEPPAKARLREIDARLSVLGPLFADHVRKAMNAFHVLIEKPEELSGLPESAKEGARHAAAQRGEEGKWLFTLDQPSLLPVLQYADDRALREKMWRAHTMRGCTKPYDNAPLVLEIVALRHEKARLLGYDTYADFVLERRMAQTPAHVMGFLETLKTAYLPAARQDLGMLQAFARESGQTDDLMPWDVGYYAEKLRENLFHFSGEDLRPYFPLERVMEGVFAHFEMLLGVRFRPAPALPTWHEDVKAYEVEDQDTGRFLGVFYADLFPRAGKKSGAWATTFRDQGLYRGKIAAPVVAIVCNLSKPTDRRPSLLSHGEVLTVFHEMGHATHALLSNVTYRSLAGVNVLWDFVELPSQIQENWCYEPETLDGLAGHFETGEKIPATLIAALRESRHFMVGWSGLTQLRQGILDMAWHGARYAAESAHASVVDVGAFEDAAVAGLSLFPRLGGSVSCSFGHLFAGGYAAGYYSYKWAEVLDADAFALFTERGLYDKPTACAFRESILERGGSEHPRTLYERFRGRDPDPDALLIREGLHPPSSSEA